MITNVKRGFFVNCCNFYYYRVDAALKNGTRFIAKQREYYKVA